MARLDRLFVHPIKSLEATAVSTAEIVENGALEWDRRYAIVDENGAYVNGKRESRIHRLRADFDLERETVALREHGGERAERFHLESDRDALADRLSEFVGSPVELLRDDEGGFPDDTDASGPTVIAAKTIEAVADWFDADAGETRRRLRPNLVVGDAPAFWEDRLYDDPGRVVPFEVGTARFYGVNPCQRCVVPTRDPDTGESTPGFRETFAARREENLPEWANESRFDHFFRLMVNTAVAESSRGRTLQAGDEITIREPIEAAT